MRAAKNFYALTFFTLLTFAAWAQPVNDLCDDAILLDCGVLYTESIENATTTGVQPTCITSCCDTIDTYIGVWYTFPGSGDLVNISTDVAETNFNTEIQIFTGSCGNLTCVNGNDNGGTDFVSGLTSVYEFVTMPDSTYFVYVDGNELDTGSFGIVLTCNPCNNYIVSDTADAGPGTLRDVIGCAQSGSTITISSAIDGMPINLYSGPIVVNNKELKIVGNGVGSTIIDGILDDDDRLFSFENGSNVTLEDMHIQHGGGSGFSGQGGALSVSADSRIQLVRCHLNDHMALGEGGVAAVAGSFKAINCIFEGNTANNAAVVKLNGNAYVSIQQCLLYDNSAVLYSIAHADDVDSRLEVLLSTVANNQSTNGNQALFSQGSTSLINTIFNNNVSDPINSSGTLVVRNNLMDLPGSISLDSNFIGEPYFVDPAGGNFELRDSSMAIDLGGNLLLLVDSCDVDQDDIVFEFIDVDLNGQPRRKRCRLDIGAYENSGSSNEYFVVNSDDSGIGSLRQAIICAPEGATIRFASNTNGVPIQLTSGQLVIGRDLTIIGNGQEHTIIDGILDGTTRLFTSNLSTVVEYQHMTFRNGGGVAQNQFGAGVRVFGEGKFVSCTFHDNQGSNGGALGAGTAAHIDVINCSFYNNSCGNQGGAINYSFSANIVSSLFYNNSAASLGGAIICVGGNANFINNTITNNSATTAGGGILNNATIINLDNNIISNNTSPAGANFYDNGANGNVTNSRNNLMNSSSLSGLTTGIIVGSPTFVDAANGNYQLVDTSLGVNLGDPLLLPSDACDVDLDFNISEHLPLDAAGNLRIDGCMLDIGALENGTTPCDTGQCNSPIPLTCGQPYMGTTQGGAKALNAFSCTSKNLSGAEIIHELIVSAQADITITLSNMVDDLDVLLLSDCASSSSCLAFGDSTIVTTVTPGTYYVVVDGASLVQSTYTLAVDCSQAAQPCLENALTLNNPLIPLGVYHATQTVTSNATITNSNVQFKAGNSVTLNSVFEVSLGADFEAIIEPCP